MINELPRSLALDVRVELYQGLLDRVPLFQGVEESQLLHRKGEVGQLDDLKLCALQGHDAAVSGLRHVDIFDLRAR